VKGGSHGHLGGGGGGGERRRGEGGEERSFGKRMR